MSETLSEPDSSQNDSEVNFRPGPSVLDVEDEAGSSVADQEDHFVGPYVGEPLAVDSWLANYRDLKKREEERLQEL